MSYNVGECPLVARRINDILDTQVQFLHSFSPKLIACSCSNLDYVWSCVANKALLRQRNEPVVCVVDGLGGGGGTRMKVNAPLMGSSCHCRTRRQNHPKPELISLSEQERKFLISVDLSWWNVSRSGRRWKRRAAHADGRTDFILEFQAAGGAREPRSNLQRRERFEDASVFFDIFTTWRQSTSGAGTA